MRRYRARPLTSLWLVEKQGVPLRVTFLPGQIWSIFVDAELLKSACLFQIIHDDFWFAPIFRDLNSFLAVHDFWFTELGAIATPDHDCET